MKRTSDPPISAEIPPVADELEPPKPLLRGWLHQVAFFVSVPAGIALVIAAPTAAARVAAVVYALSLALLFGTSAVYHRRAWLTEKALRRMQRLDHSMIYVLIAGTYTPFALTVLRGPWAIAILILVWTGAIVGIALRWMSPDRLHVAGGVLYITLGWLAIIRLPELIRGLSGVGIGLIFAGGVLYSAGALVLARRRPDPSPAFFGYHEVWHSMTIGASACMYAAILLVFLGLT